VIKIDFVDFWPSFDKHDNFFTRLLRRYLDISISDNPDYIFVSLFGARFLQYDCVKIGFFGENIRPNFDFFDYVLGFDWLTYGDRYYRLPLYRCYDTWRSLGCRPAVTHAQLQQKTGFCNFIYSNGDRADSTRTRFFHQLSKYKSIVSGGRHLNNLGYCVPDKLAFIKDFKFTIAFENESFAGYTTEKITDAFAAGTVPIYWGNPLIANDFDSGSFVNCHEFANFDQVIDYIIELDNNDELFLKKLNAPVLPQGIPGYLTDEAIANYLMSIFANKSLRRIEKTSFSWLLYETATQALTRSNCNRKVKKYIDKLLP
jgi:hypothetical protein